MVSITCIACKKVFRSNRGISVHWKHSPQCLKIVFETRAARLANNGGCDNADNADSDMFSVGDNDNVANTENNHHGTEEGSVMDDISVEVNHSLIEWSIAHVTSDRQVLMSIGMQLISPEFIS